MRIALVALLWTQCGLGWGAESGADGPKGTVLLGGSPAFDCYRNVVNWNDDLEPCDTAIAHQTLDRRELAGTYSNRGILLLRAGEARDALADQDRAVQLEPLLDSLWINRAKVLMAQRRYDEALENLGRAVALAGDALGVAYYNRALLFETLGDMEGAVQDARRAVAASPESESYRYFLERLPETVE